ncbi:HEPN domain-containing protein [Luteibaculum oceani]|uniref:Uncharacterized protein n=1 Tax=Luteibaculum oceani TaxID=1294296 RepID=A0A5C6V1Q6_9FLAO|nr:HEPN domain-containing protein [Luteibaculum oceani]TXC78770.1 hypothetical protein FRX97_06015 [Luteibaculum oceani]
MEFTEPQEKVLAELKQIVKGYPIEGRLPADVVTDISQHKKAGKTEKIKALVCAVPEFTIFDGGLQHEFEAYNHVRIDDFISTLIHIALRNSPERAIQGAVDYAVNRKFKAFIGAVVPKLDIDSSFTFSNGITLMSSEEIPNQFVKKRIHWDDFIGMHRPETILCYIFEHPVPSTNDIDEVEKLFLNEEIEQIHLTAVLISLVVAKDSGCHIHEIIKFTEETVPLVNSGVMCHPRPVKSNGIIPNYFGALAFNDVDSLIKAFNGLPKPLQERLRVALNFLNYYKSNDSIVERAIFLRCSMESAFQVGNKSGIREKLSWRSAHLFCKNEAEKIEMYKKVRAIYSATSDSVHEGKFDGDLKDLAFAADIVKKAIVIQINGGQVNWDNTPIKEEN